MKAKFTKDSGLRKHLQDGRWFLVFRPDAGDEPAGHHGPDHECFHVSLMYLKPYRPTFQRMHIQARHPNGFYELKA
eukprot:5328311-Pyramimonas_sp.AAC.1